MPHLGDSANGVAVRNGRCALAIQVSAKIVRGLIALYASRSLYLLQTFLPAGNSILVANGNTTPIYELQLRK